MDDKKKKMLIGGAALVGVFLTGIGATVAIMAGGKTDGPRKDPYAVATPTQADVDSQPGDLSIEPMPISLSRTPDGQIQGIATVSALFKDFTVGDVKLTDPRLSYKSACLQQGQVIKTGTQCNVTITFNPTVPGAAAAPATTPVASMFQASAPAKPAAASASAPAAAIELVVMGNSSTPGGKVVPIEKHAAIANADANAPAGAPVAGVNPATQLPGAAGAIPAGAPAPAGIDPYGAPPANAALTSGAVGANGIATPPVADGSGAAVAGASATGVSGHILTPREQFILARRQAVLAGVVVHGPSAQQQQQKPSGTWDDLKLPTSTSSLPQDMSRVVTMDRIITAVLVRTYDSQSSQQVVAQVDRNVYGAMGRTILIPRGSQIIGTAQGGGERVAIQWTQIIRPDGARLVFTGTAGDAVGQSGVPGHVNQRLGKRYGGILLGTLMEAGTAKIFGANQSAGSGVNIGSGGVANNNGAIITDIVRQNIQKIVDDVNQRNQNVQPIITVPAGTRLTIVPTQDLQMRPMEAPVEEVHSYPRPQNGGAPFNAPATYASYDAQQPQNHRSGNSSAQQPFPTATVPTTGSTPPWDSN